jgi:hypothetical protein
MTTPSVRMSQTLLRNWDSICLLVWAPWVASAIQGAPWGAGIDSKRLHSFTRVIIASETRQALRMDPTSRYPPYLSYIGGAKGLFTDTSVIHSSLPGIRRGVPVNH